MIDALCSITSDIIRERFPGRGVLTPPEVAEVWRGERTRGAVAAIGKRLSRGTLIPGPEKNGGRWEIPVGSLIKAIESLDGGRDDEDEEDEQPVHSQAGPPSGTRRRTLGPRMSDTAGFWDEVFTELDRLQAQWRQAALGGQAIYGWTQVSVARRKAMADEVINDKPDATYTDDQAAILCGRDIRTLRRWRKAGGGPAYATKRVKKEIANRDVVYTEIVYERDALLKWLKSQKKHMRVTGIMLWKADEIGRVARDGTRNAGSLLDLLQAEHASRESLALAMILYRQQAADELDEAAWRLAVMPREAGPGERSVL